MYSQTPPSLRVRTGAEILLADSLNSIVGKRVAIVANHTSQVAGVHLVDALRAKQVNIVRVFAPEHGFRGTADAGEHVANAIDTQTGLPLISLYGANKQPTAEQLADVDIVIFDIQDVGTRHYTYLSTMCLVMEACARAHKTFLLLDRPNPNGWYTDGLVMEEKYTSFIGTHPVPIVHGMTLGEYAQMANVTFLQQPCRLRVIWCEGYRHAMRWQETGLPWLPPSPNLGSVAAAEWYPLLCWYEATPFSVGRGTDSAFQLLGFPNLPQFPLPKGLLAENITFRPRSIVGKAKTPPCLGETCAGIFLQHIADDEPPMRVAAALLAATYRTYSAKSPFMSPFFNDNFEKWSGSRQLRQQITAATAPEVIYQSWQPAIERFKALRKPFLHYP